MTVKPLNHNSPFSTIASLLLLYRQARIALLNLAVFAQVTMSRNEAGEAGKSLSLIAQPHPEIRFRESCMKPRGRLKQVVSIKANRASELRRPK